MYGYPNSFESLTQISGKSLTNTAFPTSKAALSTGSTNSLSATNPASLQITNTDTFIFGGWMTYTDSAAIRMIFTKGKTANANISYQLRVSATRKPILTVCKDNINTLTTLTGTINLSGVFFLLCWYDGTNLNLQVNANTPDTVAHAPTAFSDPGGDLFLFSDGTVTGITGTVDEWFFCKNPTSMSAAISAIQSRIYNGGSGIRYYDLRATDKTTIGLVSWWGLDEATASTRSDLYGTATLTSTGTITQTNPLVV